MSWYIGKNNWPGGAEDQREVKTILKLIGSFSEKDEEILKQGLMSLQGVKKVNLNISTNRLLVTFDQQKTEVTLIALKVGQLGYQYVKRA